MEFVVDLEEDNVGWLDTKGDSPHFQAPQAVRRAAQSGLGYFEDVLVHLLGEDSPHVEELFDTAHSAMQPFLTGERVDTAQLESCEFMATQVANLLNEHGLAAGLASPDVQLAVDIFNELMDECDMFFRKKFKRRPDGTFDVRWRGVDVVILTEALEEFVGRLGAKDDSLQRLFPPAYPDDAERNAGWEVLAHAELIERRENNVETLRRILSTSRATVDDLDGALRTINDLRLMAAHDAGVADLAEDELERLDPSNDALLRYHHLSYLLMVILDAVEAAGPGTSPRTSHN